MALRAQARRTVMGLRTALGLGRMGFFTPYRYARGVEPLPRYPEIEALFASHEERFTAVLDRVEARADDFVGFGGDPPAPRLDQAWFPSLDMAAAYALLRENPPKRIVEVGSGHSTRALARAMRDSGGGELICIDPAPRAVLDGLPLRLERALLSEAHLPFFDALEPDDVAFFDSSHILWPGLDVDLILNRILPRLAPGVRVHIHDMLLPDAYPEGWRWRGYTEQNALGGWLLSGALEPLFASHFAVTRLGALGRPAIAALPRHAEAVDTSLWTVKAR